MRILFLTQIIPYPPDAGPRVKTWHVLRYLVDRGHEVILASFVRPDEVAHVPVLEELCTAVYTVPIQRSRVKDVGYFLRSNLTGRPFLIERDDLPQMRQVVDDVLASEQIDVIHADQLTMTQFALGKRPFTIFDAHNATWTITKRIAENARWFLRPVLALETNRIKRYETKLVEEFSHTMVVIDQDKDALTEDVPANRKQAVGAKITSIPIAVDTEKLQPANRDPNSINIMTLGSLNYPPNADGIRWFLQEVFPLVQKQVPNITLTIIGKNPPSDFVQAAAEQPDHVDVTGYVVDLDPYMDAAVVMVVPVRAGSGMRVRLLEAFARGMPCVTTTIGLEGIHATHDKEVLIADDPESFAVETLRLLNDAQLRESLSENGRKLAVNEYDWQVALKRMDAVFDRAKDA